MLDDDGDGIYTLSLDGIPSGHFPAIFAYGADTENLNAEWAYSTNKGDRLIVVDGADVNESFEFAKSRALSIANNDFSTKVSIYPNPATDRLMYSFNSLNFEKVVVNLDQILF